MRSNGRWGASVACRLAHIVATMAWMMTMVVIVVMVVVLALLPVVWVVVSVVPGVRLCYTDKTHDKNKGGDQQEFFHFASRVMVD